MTSRARSESIAGVKLVLSLTLAFAVLGAGSADVATASDPGVLDGVYRISWTQKALLAAGATALYASRNLGYAHGGPAVITITFHDGVFTARTSPPLCHGTYTVDGATVTIRQSRGCHGTVMAGWTLRGDTLRLRVSYATDTGDEVLFGVRPWKKIG